MRDTCQELGHSGGDATGTWLKAVADADVVDLVDVDFALSNDISEDSLEHGLWGSVLEGSTLSLAQSGSCERYNDHIVI